MTRVKRRTVSRVCAAARVGVCVIDRHHSGDRDRRRGRLHMRLHPTRRHPLVQEVLPYVITSVTTHSPTNDVHIK